MIWDKYTAIGIGIVVLGVIFLSTVQMMCVYEYEGHQELNGSITKKVITEDPECYTFFQFFGARKEYNKRMWERAETAELNNTNHSSISSGLPKFSFNFSDSSLESS